MHFIFEFWVVESLYERIDNVTRGALCFLTARSPHTTLTLLGLSFPLAPLLSESEVTRGPHLPAVEYGICRKVPCAATAITVALIGKGQGWRVR